MVESKICVFFSVDGSWGNWQMTGNCDKASCNEVESRACKRPTKYGGKECIRENGSMTSSLNNIETRIVRCQDNILCRGKL